MRTLITCSLLLGGLLATARAGVIVVDPAGGPGATLLASAITGAQNGDVILLRAGDYASPPGMYTLNNKGLTIVADTGGGMVPCNNFWVQALGAGKQLVLRGLDMSGPGSVVFAKVEIEDGPGVVWLEDCTAVGVPGLTLPSPFDPNGFLHLPGAPAINAYSGSRLVVQGGSYTGGHGADGTGAPFVGVTTDGGAAIHMEWQSRVVVHDAAIEGGRGGNGIGATNGGQGANGIDLAGGGGARLLLLGSTLVGGDGGSNLTPNPGTGGNGGKGLSSADASGQIWLRDTAPTGGAAGLGGPGGFNGAPGSPFFAPFGTLGTFSAPWRTLSLPAPLREGQSATFSLHGQPGDVVLILFALTGAALPLPKHQGAVVVDPATMGTPFALVTLPTADLDVPFTVPALPVGFDDLVFPVQSAFVDTQGESTLGGASMFIWIGAGF